jgi:HK97 family phage portal protein
MAKKSGFLSSKLQSLRSSIVRLLSPDMQAWLTGMDLPDSNEGAKLVSPYQQSAWIYIAISVIAENLAQIPFRISRVGADAARRIRALNGSSSATHRDFRRRALNENVVDSGPVVDLFNRPHPSMDRQLFWEQVVSWDCLRGEFFILPLDDSNQPVDLAERAPVVTRIITLNPDLFWHMVIGFELTAWRYTGSPLMSPIPSEMLVPSEVIHSRNVNPYLYWRGMSPLLVAMLPASADYAAEMFQKGLLMNNADTGVIATTEQNLTPEQREQFTTALRERKRKAGTPDRPLFLSSGVKIEKPSISNVDMQFLETRKLLRQEIGAIFKVPESLMGFSEAKSSPLSGGGNALAEDKLTFLEQNLANRCHRLEAAVEPIIKTFGPDLVGWFDIEGLPVMQEGRRARLDSAVKAFSLSVPFNEINRVYDLGFPKLPWADIGYLPFSVQRADEASQPLELPSEGKPEKPSPSNGKPANGETAFGSARSFLSGLSTINSKLSTASLWEKHVRARRKTVALFTSKTKRVLAEFRSKTLAKLDHVHLQDSASASASVSSAQSVQSVVKSLIDLIFSAHDFGVTLKTALTAPILDALQQAGEDLRDEIGRDDPWTMPPKVAQEFLRSRTLPIQGVGGTVRDQLNTSLEAGITAGETHEELAQRVRAVFTNLGDAEAKRVAMTEVNIAFNTARQQAMADSGVQYKSWLSSHGPHVRDGHAQAEEDYLDSPIPIDEPFKVTSPDGVEEELQFPGDDSLGASAGNIINCQCVQIAAEKPTEE